MQVSTLSVDPSRTPIHNCLAFSESSQPPINVCCLVRVNRPSTNFSKECYLSDTFPENNLRSTDMVKEKPVALRATKTQALDDLIMGVRCTCISEQSFDRGF